MISLLFCSMTESIAETSPRTLMTGCLLAVEFAGSAFVWSQLTRRAQQGKLFLDQNESPQTVWNSSPELFVVFFTLFMMASSSLARMVSSTESPVLNLNSIVADSVFKLAVSLVLCLALVIGARSWGAIGITAEHSLSQIRTGIRGFLATVLPMAISMTVTIPVRGAENQHSLLKLLMESPDVQTIAIIAFSAVVSAPLFEELLYRVILQGWLTTLFGPVIVIPVVAFLFALVHGWRNGLALLPLAFVLGYVFHRTRSYISVVVIHALFNATMLALQLLNLRN